MSWGPLEELASLFAPGMRHEQERRKQLEMMRDDEGNAADPLSTIDLDRGIAVIRLPAQANENEPDDQRKEAAEEDN
jgi:Family of unknown function (DUF6191)